MQMEMAGNTRTGCSSKVQSNVEPMRFERNAQPLGESLNQLQHLAPLNSLKSLQGSDMSVRSHH